jgi:nitrogen regulatory protein PII
MKMVMIICPGSRRDDVRNVLHQHGVEGYSEMTGVKGEGKTGKHLGTQAWPMESIMLLSVVADDKAYALIEAMKECSKRLLPEEGMRAFVMPVEEAI